MNPLPSFSEFFQALWGYSPFLWQRALAEQVSKNDWPKVIDLPTASGKTACIDIAIYALASQWKRPPAERSTPRRIWFVVDRRIVVDEAFKRAWEISQKLKEARKGSLKGIADRLRYISGTENPLSTARLRGGILHDNNWGPLPSQPAVITSTVDQVGSRLLFRCYGHSQLTASIFAGLVANDSLILLDEAHCSVPFMQTMHYIEKYQKGKWAKSSLRTPFAFGVLSATIPDSITTSDIFPRKNKNHLFNDNILQKRFSASKLAELINLNTNSKNDDPLPDFAAACALTYVKQDGKQRVAVIVNRIRTAWKISEKLRNDSGEKVDVVLLTGRLRPYERDQLIKRWTPVLRVSSPEHPNKPVIIVSTQCIEVGADFNFDAMVTEAASLDAMKQRFGRLNRTGTVSNSPATVLVRNEDTKEKNTDPIYGTAIATSWKIMSELAHSVFTGNKNRKVLDFGINALEQRTKGVDLSSCLAPRQDAPALLPSHLDLLCQTYPRPAVEPDIQLYLHGSGQKESEVKVLWRSDLDCNRQETWLETVALCPPLGAEMLSVPLNYFRNWLTLPDDTIKEIDNAADIEGVSIPPFKYKEEKAKPHVIWRGRDRSNLCTDAKNIAPDDVVVLPSSYGIDGLGQREPTNALGEHLLDLWELCRQESGKPPAVRINRAVLAPWINCPPVKSLVNLAEETDCNVGSLQEAISAICLSMDEHETRKPPEWLIELFQNFSKKTIRIEQHPANGLVLFSRYTKADNLELDLFADDDDLLSTAGREVSLGEHSKSVELTVKKIAGRCLSPSFDEVLSLVASWHDMGKLDDRFQLLLHQGNEIAVASAKEPLAKSISVPTSPARRKAIREASGLPDNFRHEMLSLKLAELFANPPANNAELFFHLIASHHGYARPFAPICNDQDILEVSSYNEITSTKIKLSESSPPAYRADSGICERFWQLNRQYGWWGLAYLEAIVRLSDWYASAQSKQIDVTVSAKRLSKKPPVMQKTNKQITLTGLNGANPLGFLTALGVIDILHRKNGYENVRLNWLQSVTWNPVLTGLPHDDQTKLSKSIADELTGQKVSEYEENERVTTQKKYEDLKKKVGKKTKEFKKQLQAEGMRGKQLSEELGVLIAPIQKIMDDKKKVWLKALRKSIPWPELALGKHIKCSREEFRDEYIPNLLKNSTFNNRKSIDLLAAFASDGCFDEKTKDVEVTPFCFITGSGHQYFLDTVRQLTELASPELVQDTLFNPWTYKDEKLSMRWDPTEDRRYALMDRDPTANDNKVHTVWMANLLAYHALGLFSSAPSMWGLQTTGWWNHRKNGRFFTWPIWQYPLDIKTIQSLLLLPELQNPSPNSLDLCARGVLTAFRAQRIQVGNPPLYKINFTQSFQI